MTDKPGVIGNHIVVNKEKCHNCGACVAVCPENALFLWGTWLDVDLGRCKLCVRCLHTCPVGALSLASNTGRGQ